MPRHHAQQRDESELAPGPTSVALATGCTTASVSVIDLYNVPNPAQPEGIDVIDLVEVSDQTDDGPACPALQAEVASRPRKSPRTDVTRGKGQPADAATSSPRPHQPAAAIPAEHLALLQREQYVADQHTAVAQQNQSTLPASTPPQGPFGANFDPEIVEVIAEEPQPGGKHAPLSDQSVDLRRRNAVLMQELESLQAQVRLSAGCDAAHHANSEFPTYWSDQGPAESADAGNVQLVKLPIPGQEGVPDLPSSLNPEIVFQLMEQGFTPNDAVAALLACDGDADRAQVLVLEQHGTGGTAAHMHGSDDDMLRQLGAWAGQAESQVVLQRFARGGMKHVQVRCIERVQNKMLWRRFALRRKELQQKHGHLGSNDAHLFHGADKRALEAIVNEGFDIRVSKAGSLGQGTYFAQKSSYSLQFSQSSQRAALKAAELQSLQEQQSQGHVKCPAFLANGYAMLLCPVALGKVGKGTPDLRRPPPGFDSVCRTLNLQKNDVFAVFDNNSSYPEYLIHFA